MRYHRIIVLPLIIALLLNMLPCSFADQADQNLTKGYGSMADYTKVRWFAQSDDQRAELNGEPNQNERLEVNAAPGTTWSISAEFVKVRNGQLLPYHGELDVSRYCEWTMDELTLVGDSVTLPETEGEYTITGRFVDDEGNLYTCDIVFNVSEDNRDASSDKKPRRSRSAQTVEAKVAELAAQCRAQGFTTEYDIALWLHDWLIYNANYDYTYSNYDADGVLLKGTGVCDSYSKAFQLLLNEFQIENQRVISVEMNHAWNLVKLDGIWCHIDCTWDDPGTGGDENHTYFGMNAALMGRDHKWNGSYPSANSLDNYYPIRESMLCFSSASELDAILSEEADNQTEKITVVYIGNDPDQTAMAAVMVWLGKNDWKYGIVGYGVNGTTYICSLEAVYGEPWDQPPDNHLDTPVDAPDFELDSPVGRYVLNNYANNGIVLIFGRTICGNTRALLNMLSSNLSDLYAGGVDVLVSMYDAAESEDLEGIEVDYPGYHYAYGSGVMWDYLYAAGYPTGTSVTFPCVFVINREGKITYYSTGYVVNVTELLGEAYAVATNKPLPDPEKHQNIEPMLNGTGNVNDISNGKDIVSTVQSVSQNRHVILLVCTGFLPNALDYYENHYSLFNKLGIAMVASFDGITETQMAAYPNCMFVKYSEDDFWALQYATDYVSGTYISGLLNVFITQGGEIAAYTKGSTLNLINCALAVVRRLDYDATIPTSLSVIEDRTFLGTAFSRLDLSNGSLTEIRSGAFANCGSLEVVRIPEGVTTIADDAFANSDPIIICTIGTAGYRFARAKGLDYICE